jgi:ElaB/YqjD/DUF883 family membrane-anchored ribosome-binding protein
MMEQNPQNSLYSEDRPLRQLGQTIQSDIESVRSTAMGWERQLEDFVRERPVAAVMSALGLGFFVARIFSRR